MIFLLLLFATDQFVMNVFLWRGILNIQRVFGPNVTTQTHYIIQFHHTVVCRSMRYSPLVLMAFPDGLLFSGNDIWVFTVLTGWDSPQAEWVPEGWLDGAAGRFMRRDGKQTAAMAKTKVLPFGSSKSEARGKSQPSRKQTHAPYSLHHKCSLHSSQIWAVPQELGHYIMRLLI